MAVILHPVSSAVNEVVFSFPRRHSQGKDCRREIETVRTLPTHARLWSQLVCTNSFAGKPSGAKKSLAFSFQLRKMSGRFQQAQFHGAVSPGWELAHHLKAGGQCALTGTLQGKIQRLVAICFKGTESQEGESQLPRDTGFMLRRNNTTVPLPTHRSEGSRDWQTPAGNQAQNKWQKTGAGSCSEVTFKGAGSSTTLHCYKPSFSALCTLFLPGWNVFRPLPPPSPLRKGIVPIRNPIRNPPRWSSPLDGTDQAQQQNHGVCKMQGTKELLVGKPSESHQLRVKMQIWSTSSRYLKQFLP